MGPAQSASCLDLLQLDAPCVALLILYRPTWANIFMEPLLFYHESFYSCLNYSDSETLASHSFFVSLFFPTSLVWLKSLPSLPRSEYLSSIPEEVEPDWVFIAAGEQKSCARRHKERISNSQLCVPGFAYILVRSGNILFPGGWPKTENPDLDLIENYTADGQGAEWKFQESFLFAAFVHVYCFSYVYLEISVRDDVYNAVS